MGFNLPMPKVHIRKYQHANFHVPIFKTEEVIAIYSFQCKSMRRLPWFANPNSVRELDCRRIEANRFAISPNSQIRIESESGGLCTPLLTTIIYLFIYLFNLYTTP